MPILTARLPVARIKERWATYAAGIDAGGHDAATKARLLAQSALWRNVYVAETYAQAEDELASINQIIGASYGGVPSLTATAGPGLALMTEGITWPELRASGLQVRIVGTAADPGNPERTAVAAYR